MISFKQFVLEQKARNVDQADNIARYVVKRQNKHREHKVDMINIKPENNLRGVEYAVRNSRNFEQIGKKTTLPTKDLTPTQRSVDHSSQYFRDHKMDDNEPLTVVKHGGKHYIWDGHHRWFRNKLLRKPHTEVILHDLDKNK